MVKEAGISNKESKENRIAVDVAIFNNRGEVLLGKRLADEGFDTWGFPGGRMKSGERIKECAQRELREELGDGIEVEITDQILAVRENNVPPNFVPHFTIILKGFLKSGQPQIMEPHKCSEWKFVDIKELDKYSLFSGVKETLENFAKNRVLVVTDWYSAKKLKSR